MMGKLPIQSSDWQVEKVKLVSSHNQVLMCSVPVNESFPR